MRIIRIRRSSREGNGPQPQSIRKGGEQQPQAINIGKGATTTSNKREGGHHIKEQVREGGATATSNKQGDCGNPYNMASFVSFSVYCSVSFSFSTISSIIDLSYVVHSI